VTRLSDAAASLKSAMASSASPPFLVKEPIAPSPFAIVSMSVDMSRTAFPRSSRRAAKASSVSRRPARPWPARRPFVISWMLSNVASIFAIPSWPNSGF